MLKKVPKILEQARIKKGRFASSKEYGFNGAFLLKIKGRSFQIISSDQEGWDHVSISMPDVRRCPTWPEMCKVKDLFFGRDEVCIQVHPAQSNYINDHPFCLHLWRCHDPGGLIVPPLYMV